MSDAAKIEMARDCFSQDSRIVAAYVLGSAARGTLREDSDIDFGLIVKTGSSLSALEIHDMAATLTVRLGRPVDIGLISSSNLIYARECFFTGKQIWCRDTFQAALVEATLLGMAMQLEFERREVLHAYSA